MPTISNRLFSFGKQEKPSKGSSTSLQNTNINTPTRKSWVKGFDHEERNEGSNQRIDESSSERRDKHCVSSRLDLLSEKQESPIGSSSMPKSGSTRELACLLEDADRKYDENEFDEALALYLNALPVFEKRLSNANFDVDATVGDIHVKVCSILQEIGEFGVGISHLTKAKDAYIATLGKLGEATESDDHIKSILIQKMIHVSVDSGDAYLAMGEMDKASECYMDATKLCRTLFPSDASQLLQLLNKSAIFLSTCINKHVEGMNLLKEALSISIKNGGGKMTIESAQTLDNMGRIYIQRLHTKQSKAITQDIKQAEACFTRAAQLYRASKSDRVTETLCNLTKVRAFNESEHGNGILKNVRFDPQFVDHVDRQYAIMDFADEESASSFESMGTYDSGFGFLDCGTDCSAMVFNKNE